MKKIIILMLCFLTQAIFAAASKKSDSSCSSVHSPASGLTRWVDEGKIAAIEAASRLELPPIEHILSSDSSFDDDVAKAFNQNMKLIYDLAIQLRHVMTEDKKSIGFHGASLENADKSLKSAGHMMFFATMNAFSFLKYDSFNEMNDFDFIAGMMWSFAKASNYDEDNGVILLAKNLGNPHGRKIISRYDHKFPWTTLLTEEEESPYKDHICLELNEANDDLAGELIRDRKGVEFFGAVPSSFIRNTYYNYNFETLGLLNQKKNKLMRIEKVYMMNNLKNQICACTMLILVAKSFGVDLFYDAQDYLSDTPTPKMIIEKTSFQRYLKQSS